MIKLPEVYDLANKKPVRILHPSRVSCDLALKSISTARIETTIDDGLKFGEWVKIYYPNDEFGIFRANVPENSYESGKAAITLDHGMATLSDNIINVGDSHDEDGISQPTYFEGTVTQVFTKLLSYQKTKHWTLGTVETNEHIKVEVDFDNLLTKLNDSMSLIPDYYLKYDQSVYPWKIHIVKYPATVTAEGRLSRNVTSAKVRYDDSDLCTRVYCEALSAGKMDSANISKYGIREQRYYLQDVSDADAQKACRRYLKNRENPKISVTIEGGDFSKLTGVSLDRVKMGDLYRLVIPSYNVTIKEQIVRIAYTDIVSRPYELSITLGRDREDLSLMVSKARSQSSHTATASRKAGTQVMHVYEKLEKEQIGTDGILRKAGIQYDENGVLLFAKELGMDKNAGTIHAPKGQTYVPLKKAKDDGSQTLLNMPDGSGVSILEKGTVWSQVRFRDSGGAGTSGYVRTQYLTEGIEKLSGAFNVTAERLTSDYENKVTGAYSHIEQTAESLTSTIGSTKEELESKIKQTRDAISLVVNDKTGQITPASIVASINKDAKTSNIALSADTIDIDGIITKIVTKDLFASHGAIPKLIATSIYTSHIYVQDPYGIGQKDLTTAFYSCVMRKSGNNYYLDFFRVNDPGTAVTVGPFSRAVTSMDGVWSGGILTVTPSPQGSPKYITQITKGQESKSGKTIAVSILASYGSQQQYTQEIRNFNVDASEVYDDGYKVTAAQISASDEGMYPKSSGSYPISNRTKVATYARPSQGSYLLFDITVHGRTKGFYYELS